LIETIEQWSKRPEWIVLFIGANDLLSEFGIVGDARPPSPEQFEADYRALVARLRKRMAPNADSRQFFVMTLPDVTRLPLLQPLPPRADDGDGGRFPDGSLASAFLIPFRKHFQEDEVWRPDQIAAIRQRARDYNDAIERIAADEGLTIVDIEALMEELRRDSSFVTPASPYFSPDLAHPSFRTHARIADRVADGMSKITGEPVPPLVASESPLPHSGDFAGRDQTRIAAMMRLAYLALESGPLPPRLTGRIGVEAAGQFGEEPIGDATVSLLAGLEVPPSPLLTHPIMRLGASVRAAALAFDEESENVELFPQRSLEVRLGLGFERIGMWTWTRFEIGGLLTLDGAWDGGMYARGEWRGLYAEAAGRGWDFDRVEAGLRFGIQPGRQGRNGN
jgi:lysophospholipase L1-like esterase